MHKEHAVVVVLSVFFTLLALAPVGVMVSRHLPREVATVDLQRLVEEEQQHAIDLLRKGSGPVQDQREAVEKQTVQFARRLSAIVDTLGSECHCVIINKAALLGGAATDYTDLVRERVRRQP